MDVIGRLPTGHLLVVVGLLLMGIVLTSYGSHAPVRRDDLVVSFDDFPREIDGLRFIRSNRYEPDVENMLGADTYIDYYYASDGYGELEVLVSYFSSLREGKQFHSPKNCMLGAGWEALGSGQLRINWGGRHTPVNSMKVRRGDQTLYVVYWVQGRGRIMASEYRERIYRVIDSFLAGRTDGAFVRITLSGERGEVKEFLPHVAEKVANLVQEHLPQ